MHHIFTHWGDWLGGAAALGIVAHAVNTFPTQGLNQYGLWILGMIKYVVGQRTSGANAMSGQGSVVVAVDPQSKLAS